MEGTHEDRNDAQGQLHSKQTAESELSQADSDTIELLGHALELKGEERRKYLHGKAGGYQERYDRLVRLLHWSELRFQSDAPPGDSLPSTSHSDQLEVTWNQVLGDIQAKGQGPHALERGAEIAKGGMGRITKPGIPP